MEILPVEYVNDPDVICQNDNMISINAAVEVDLFGQVCAESVGTKHMSGSGGQIDYVRGACQSRGGKSFIAFTSTAKGGTISKIKSILTRAPSLRRARTMSTTSSPSTAWRICAAAALASVPAS